MQTNCTCSIEQARAHLAKLEKQAEEQSKAKRNADAIQRAKQVVWTITIVKPHGDTFCDLWDDTEVFEMFPSTQSDLTDVCYNGHFGSVKYLVSRKLKRIIGYTGGGSLIDFNTIPGDRYISKEDETQPYYWFERGLRQAIAEWLAQLP